ncbi:MAG: NAD(P)/FAD-dependent oxidoreductase [Pyrinomonadaceae bacterium]
MPEHTAMRLTIRRLTASGIPKPLRALEPDLEVEDLGVEVYLNSFVKAVERGRILVNDEWIECSAVLWATGVSASPLGKKLGAPTDKVGRVLVNPDLSIPDHKNVFVIGDMAFVKMDNGNPVPGVAPAAIQMAQTVAENIIRDQKGKERKVFKYVDKGSMATIGRNKAIAEIGRIKLSGLIAWLTWLFVHLIFLIGFRNKVSVMIEWIWAYFTRERSARLITGDAEELLKTFASRQNLPTAKR